MDVRGGFVQQKMIWLSLAFLLGAFFIVTNPEKNALAKTSSEYNYFNTSPLGNIGGLAIPASCSAGFPENLYPHTTADTVDPTAPNYGTSCTSAPNACGQTNTGTYMCNGNCSALPPSNATCPVNGVCGGTHYNCTSGASMNPQQWPSEYTWWCAGANGGANSGTCSEPIPVASGTISANPNPCNLACGATCSSTITWNSSNAPGANVFVRETGGLFGGGSNGSSAAPWITGAGFNFDLRDGNNTSAPLLATVFVRGTPSCSAVNGACSATHFNCNTGTSANNNSGDPSYWYWDCMGSGGGSNALGCSELKAAPSGVISANPSPCNLACGATCTSLITWSSTNAPGANVFVRETGGLFGGAPSGSTNAPWITAAGFNFDLRNGNTTGSPLLSTVFVQGVPSCGGPINAVCGATHFNCAPGTSANNVTNATNWTWDCMGSGGGTNALGCFENMPSTPGVCGATHYNCAQGTSVNNQSNPTNWTWTCNGLNGGANSPQCSEPKVVNGICAATHYNCVQGTSANNASNAGGWTWTCNGSGGGSNANCSEPISAGNNPIGTLDIANCTEITGWTCDADNYNTALSVHIYDGGTFLTSTTANIFRADVAAAAVCGGTGAHGFTIATPASLKTGTNHSVHAYGINIGGGNNAELNLSPKTVNCAAPPLPPSVTCSAVPQNISSGGFTNFTYNSVNTTSCTTQWDSVVRGPNGGPISVGPLFSNTTLRVNCVGPGGAASCSDIVFVGAAGPNFRVCPDNASVPVGSTLQYRAYFDSTGNGRLNNCGLATGFPGIQDYTNLSNWTTTFPALAIVNNALSKGLLTGVSPGVTDVTATHAVAGTDSALVTITGAAVPNGPPSPPVITGPVTGAPNTLYPYTFLSTDPDNDNLRYGVRWTFTASPPGPFATSQYLPVVGYVPSGTLRNASNQWVANGTYTIMAYAQDIAGNMSAWSTLDVVISTGAPNVPPTASILSPANGGSYVVNTNVAFDGTGNDPDGSITRWEWWANGTCTNPSTWSQVFNDPTPDFNRSFAGLGPQQYSYRVQDNSGSYSPCTPVSFTIIPVPCVSQCNSSDPLYNNTCNGGTYPGVDSCGNPELCPGGRTCDFNWKEVAP